MNCGGLRPKVLKGVCECVELSKTLVNLWAEGLLHSYIHNSAFLIPDGSDDSNRTQNLACLF